MSPAEQAAADAAAKAQQEDADALAQFESGYTGQTLDSETPPAEVPPTETTAETPADPAEGKSASGETVETEPPVVPKADISKEQFEQLLAAANSIGDIRSAVEKLRGDAFGRMGGLERTLKGLQDATPAGQPIELTSEDLAEVKAEYPQLTESLVTGLSRVLKKMKGTGAAPAVDLEALDQRVIEKASVIAQEAIARESVRIREDVATQMLEAQHEGWRELVGPKDSDTAYRRWLKTKGPDYEKKLLSSNDPVEISRSISTFKETQKVTPAPAGKPASPDTDRKQRLAEAITPRGGKPPMPRAKTPEEEFAEGFAYQAAG